VGFGTLEAVTQGLGPLGWQSNPSFVERGNLRIGHQVAAIGRRGRPLCTDEAGVRPPLALAHVYDNCCLPHARVRHPLLAPEVTKGRGAAGLGRPCTPAMAAG